ncbi:hypothetical protein B0H34DRAFT_169467 [Crassisporium funariophilum]|nr:hypothetical protein B0H34DRAFT_169467 [Crassisporium funariophilum]
MISPFVLNDSRSALRDQISSESTASTPLRICQNDFEAAPKPTPSSHPAGQIQQSPHRRHAFALRPHVHAVVTLDDVKYTTKRSTQSQNPDWSNERLTVPLFRSLLMEVAVFYRTFGNFADTSQQAASIPRGGPCTGLMYT